MAKQKTAKKKRVTKRAREKVSSLIDQAKEPLSLLSTLKEEGMASAMLLFTIASGAAKNLKMEALRPQLKEMIQSLGFAFREDLEKLEARIEELEQKIAEKEYAQLEDEE